MPPTQRRRFLIPKTYAKLGEEPGARGYWDASIASTANAYVTAGLAIYALVQNPSLMTSEDFYLKTPETCQSAIAFLAWVCFELCCQLYYLKQWKEGGMMLVHHFSAITAWLLYLQARTSSLPHLSARVSHRITRLHAAGRLRPRA